MGADHGTIWSVTSTDQGGRVFWDVGRRRFGKVKPTTIAGGIVIYLPVDVRTIDNYRLKLIPSVCS